MNQSYSSPQRFIYPVVTILFLMVIFLTIFVVVRDIKKNINTLTTLTIIPERKDQLETEQYLILKQKFSLPEIAPRGEVITPELEQKLQEDMPPQDTVLQLEGKSSFDFSSSTVLVYNASGINGLAGKMKGVLEEVGFLKIKTGNTNPQTRNEIYIRSDIREEITKKLQENIPSLFIDGDIMEKDPSSADIVIILGHE